MKHLLHDICAWIIAIIATTALNATTAQAKVITFTGTTPITQDNVTISYTSNPGSRSGGICNLYGRTFGTMTITSAFGKIAKVDITCAPYDTKTPTADAARTIIVWDTTDRDGGTTNITLAGTTATWTGTPVKTIEFGSTGDIDVLTVDVTIEDADAPVTYMAFERINPPQGVISAKNGLMHFDIYMKDNFATTYSTFWGHPVPQGTTMTDDHGRTYPIATFSTFAGSNQLNIELASRITTPGIYTLTIPEAYNSSQSGTAPKMQFTWIVEPTKTFDLESNLVTPQDYPPLKALESFTIAPPADITFATVQHDITLTRQGQWNTAIADFDYTTIDVTADIVDGNVVITFPTPYVEPGNSRFYLPAGVITSTTGLTNEIFGASFTLDPYEYFEAVADIKPWATYEAPLQTFNITVPANINVRNVGKTIQVDGTEIPLSTHTIDYFAHTVTINLQTPIPLGKHVIYIPQGFLKATDNIISSAIELYGVEVIGLDADFPHTATTPATWATLNTATLPHTPITITFLRDIATINPDLITLYMPGGAQTITQLNTQIPEAVTISTQGPNLTIQLSQQLATSPYLDTTGQIYIQLQRGAITSTQGALNTENLWAIGYNYEYITTITIPATGWTTIATTTTLEIPENCTAYYVSNITDQYAIISTLATQGQTINAYVPLLLRGTPNTTIHCSPGNPSYIYSIPWNKTNFLAGNYEDGTPATYYATEVATDVIKWDYNRDTPMGPNHLYQLDTDTPEGNTPTFSIQPGTAGDNVTIPQGQAYLIVPEYYTHNTAPKQLLYDDDPLATNINHNTQHNTTTTTIYNLNGQPTHHHNTHSIYIKNHTKHTNP